MMENLRKQSQDTNWYEKFDLFVVLFLFDFYFLVNLLSLWKACGCQFESFIKSGCYKTSLFCVNDTCVYFFNLNIL